eukprot:3365242-Amphidinium_carterae.3
MPSRPLKTRLKTPFILLELGFRLPQHEAPTYSLSAACTQTHHQGGDLQVCAVTVTPQLQSAASPLRIALISESLNHMTKLLQRAGHHVEHSCHHVQAVRRCLPEEMQALAVDLQDNPPDLLWLHYTGHPHPRRRSQTRLLLPWVQAVRRQHPSVQRHIPVREEIVNAAPSEDWRVALPHYNSFRSCHALPDDTSPERGFNVISRSTYALPTSLSSTDHCHLLLVSHCPRSAASCSSPATAAPPVPPAYPTAAATAVPTVPPAAYPTAAATAVPPVPSAYPTAAHDLNINRTDQNIYADMDVPAPQKRTLPT